MRPERLFYYFCRVQLPGVTLPEENFAAHLRRMYTVHRQKQTAVGWDLFLRQLHALDGFLVAACLENDSRAWEALFAARTGRSDQLLVDALRTRAVHLFPHDEEKQDSAVSDFWGHLLVAESEGSIPILARYDAQRPLVPWLIRIFQNWQISRLRSPELRAEALPDDDYLVGSTLASTGRPDGAPEARWHEAFCAAARSWLTQISDQEALVLGLRMRYRLSQREVAKLLGVHEGTISRQITDLRDRCLSFIAARLQADGWTGDDLDDLIQTEMAAMLLDEPLLSANHLAPILAAQGKHIPLAAPRISAP